MPLRPNMEPGDFLDILRRRKWIIVFSVLLGFFGATVYCVLAPNLYQSSMKLLMIPPTVSEGVIPTTVKVGSHERMAILQQEILTRNRLLTIINELGLFKESGKSAESMVDMFRGRITTSNESKSKNTFTISFYHEDPKVAMIVASRLGSFFVEESIKSREETGKETATFLSSQLEETRRKLEEQEERVKRYKLQFGGELPQQEQANLSRLQRMQDQIKINSDAIARLQDRKVLVEAQIANLERNIWEQEKQDPKMDPKQDPWEAFSPDTPASPTKLLSELALRRKKLEDLSRKYTPLHPAVVQARQDVEQLEGTIERLREHAQTIDEVSSGQSGAGIPTQSRLDPRKINWNRGELQRLRKQVASIDLETVALKRESADKAREIDEIQRKLDRLPQREQEMIALMRGYDNIKKSYEELMAKQLQAQASQKLEEQQSEERFKVFEPANFPTMPFKPETLKVLALALIASLVIGVGGAIGVEVANPTLRESREFKMLYDLPILACIPVIQDDRYKRKIAVRRTWVVGGLLSIVGAYVIFLVIHGEKVMSILHTIGIPVGGGN